MGLRPVSLQSFLSCPALRTPSCEVTLCLPASTALPSPSSESRARGSSRRSAQLPRCGRVGDRRGAEGRPSEARRHILIILPHHQLLAQNPLSEGLCVLRCCSCPILGDPWTVARQAPLSRGASPSENTRAGCHFLL